MLVRQQGEALPETTVMATSSGVEGNLGGDVRLRYKSGECKLSDVARKIVELGFSPLTEFHTLFPGYQARECIAQFCSAADKQRFLEIAGKDTGAVAMFNIVRSIRTITCNRVPMQMDVAELENLLLPPVLGKVEIMSREKETCKDKEGKPLCYTGRVHFRVPTEEFERIRHVIPTSLPFVKQGIKYCVFVNFEGSQQRCHKCSQPGHIEKDCPLLREKNERSSNDKEKPDGEPVYQSTPNKLPDKSPMKKRKLTEDTETEQKRTETEPEESDEESESDEENGSDFMEVQDATRSFSFVFGPSPGKQNLTNKVLPKPEDLMNLEDFDESRRTFAHQNLKMHA